MNREAREYLNAFHHHLHPLPEAERMDAVREIESHIEESLYNGQGESEILARLGNPRKLAKAYVSEQVIQGKDRSFAAMMMLIRFYCSTGLLSIMVIPFLATIAFGFGLSAVLSLLAGVLRTLGVPYITMNIGNDIQVPREYSMLVAVILAVILEGIAYYSWIYLRKYITYISTEYRKLLPVQRTI
ncbi:DUF1700 domain-containing protein [Paenibacillus donghaensis]|uniref:DUF1700 domain-containing protein n=1 Tax=Paenibacillus donghaensis TaxID=414771 RepID=A0A2Z2KUZ7_9BACL|nr:DUF1700 domain-containing protein [Paenibacillus donghaensis]ASA23628.1 hypothetical protein B9T62_24240 [Paenibacillus donghaensis]